VSSLCSSRTPRDTHGRARAVSLEQFSENTTANVRPADVSADRRAARTDAVAGRARAGRGDRLAAATSQPERPNREFSSRDQGGLPLDKSGKADGRVSVVTVGLPRRG